MSPTQKMILFIISLAMFMEALDSTIINTAIPVMAENLHVFPIDLKIALISYLLSLSIFIPISGWIADKFGAKRIFLSALIIFTVSSVLCGLSQNLWQLVIARVLQGFGGALMLPIGRLVLLKLFGRQQLIMAMNRVITVAAMGILLGPVAGGLIVHYVSWRWIFWINIPVGILNFVLAYHWLPFLPKQSVLKLDKLGFLLFGYGLAGLTFGLSAFSESNMDHRLTSIILGAAVISLIFYVWHSRGRKNAIVKTELFQIRTFQISVLGNLFTRLGFAGIPFLLPILMQISFGYSPQLSGLLLAPMALGVIFSKLVVLNVLRRVGYKKYLVINTILVSLLILSFLFINKDSSNYIIAAAIFFYGMFISAQFTGMNSLAYAQIDPENHSAATSIMSTLQQVSQSLGVAMSAILIYVFAPSQTDISMLTTSVFHHVFLVLGLFTLSTALVFLRLEPEDGREMM